MDVHAIDPIILDGVIDRVQQFLDSESEALIHALVELRFYLSNLTTPQRKQYWVPRGQKLILRILSEEHNPFVHLLCWDICTYSIRMTSYVADDPLPDDQDIMASIVNDGLLDCMAAEMDRRPLRPEVLMSCLLSATNVCLYRRVVNDIIRLNLVPRFLKIVRMSESTIRLRSLSLIAITNLALSSASHECLLNNGALDTAISLLGNLRSTDETELDLGLTAAFLICRIAGRDETGPGMQSIQDNRDLVDKLHWILEQVLEAGPDGIVLASHWNPANIILDVSILAQSDRNKPLLKKFIRPIYQSMREYGDTNRRLMKYSIATLLELYQHEDCRSEINELRWLILQQLQKQRPYFYDIVTFQEIEMLKTMLSTQQDSLLDILRNVRSSLPSLPRINLLADW